MYDVIIIGSGPSGLTAAIYATRASLKTLVIAGRFWGGQLMLTTLVENFPGFTDGIMGPELMMQMRKQAEKHGAEILEANFKYGDFTKKSIEVVTDDEKKFITKSVVIATGAETKWLGVPGEKEKIGRGISSCAPCDAAFFRNKKVIVVGGGDAAMEEALVLTKFASHVFLIHRREDFRASTIMQKRAFENEKITFILNTEIEEILGEQKVEGVKFKTRTQTSRIVAKEEGKDMMIDPETLGGVVKDKDKTHIYWEFKVDGVFVAIGHTPNSKVFKGVELDEKGYIIVNNHTRTNIDGVFVAGDVHDSHYQQAITAAGFGCMAALDVERWLRNQ